MRTLPHHDIWQGAAAAVNLFNAFQTTTATLARYANAFSIPFMISLNNFHQVESRRWWSRTPEENLLAYLKLATMNIEMAGRAFTGNLQAIESLFTANVGRQLAALTSGKFDFLAAHAREMRRLATRVAYDYPEAIDAVADQFGFHFERQPPGSRIAENDRFLLYQVLPTDPAVTPRADGKPVLIIPPYVLGPNILAFLPGEDRSFAHAFANQGIPTYIRIVKPIEETEAVQVMTPEEDAADMRRFAETIRSRHGLPLTLAGYCQGGFTALCNLLSGELDGLVDAFLTCVSPIDGTRSSGVNTFLQELPEAFNDLAYGARTLPNGNQVADGTLMSWMYKLKSIETETPLLNLWRDMILLSRKNGRPVAANTTAAAINYWLLYERCDLPLPITRMSFISYQTPIDAEGTLPVRIFGRRLNLKRLEAHNIPWLICYGEQDDLVEPEAAVAPLDFIDAEVTAFPKGHVAMATSWSHPDSAYALHRRYPEGKGRGPVRFQLDLQEAIDSAEAGPAGAAKKKPAAKRGRPRGSGNTRPPTGKK